MQIMKAMQVRKVIKDEKVKEIKGPNKEVLGHGARTWAKG